MRFIRFIVLITLILVGIYYFNEYRLGDMLYKRFTENIDQTQVSDDDVLSEEHQALQNENFIKWMELTEDEIINKFGKPDREDDSQYGYKSFIYNIGNDQYVQIGIKDSIVKTIFLIGKVIQGDAVQFGNDFTLLRQTLTFSNEVTYKHGLSSYIMKLNDEDKKQRPLIKLHNDLYMQLYFDTFEEKLVAVRLLTPDILLMQAPYTIEYRGSLPEELALSDSDWTEIENGMEQEVFDITNTVRILYGEKKLDWDDTVSEVAFKHSEDMFKNDYFSHVGLQGDTLKNRLDHMNISYTAAAENIAAQYPDAPSVVLGWLNSKGHRENLLHNQFTHLGVGVHRFYYTQNFLSK